MGCGTNYLNKELGGDQGVRDPEDFPCFKGVIEHLITCTFSTALIDAKNKNEELATGARRGEKPCNKWWRGYHTWHHLENSDKKGDSQAKSEGSVGTGTCGPRVTKSHQNARGYGRRFTGPADDARKKAHHRVEEG